MTWAASKIGPGGNTSDQENQFDFDGVVMDPTGSEGAETFNAAREELLRQGNGFAQKVEYVDEYLVSFIGERGELIEPRTFSANEWDAASKHAGKTGKLIINGRHHTPTDKMYLYRSATHASMKTYKSPLDYRVVGVYKNLETSINVMAHEIYHYRHPQSAHSYAYDAGHHAVSKYRKYKNGQ